MAARSDDLIVALATPPGRGAIAVVRLSGPGALALASSLTGRAEWTPRHVTRVRLSLGAGLVDDALVTIFPAPHSFTGEDVVEVSVHGSPVIVDALLAACVMAGARLARRGEFTHRAYVNGRVDLLQAEAIADLVDATTAAQVQVASAHLEGTLSASIQALGDELAELRARLEASLDFPDEGFHFITPDELATRLGDVRRGCERLLGSAHAGQRLHDGATVAIVGRPNAGKSSLFNSLLGRKRAIVAAVPGTTRDLLTEVTSFGGVPVTLIDTAGLRSTTDAIEQEGVTRAEEVLASADLVMLVVDPGASPVDLSASVALWAQLTERPRICVATRLDLVERGSAASLAGLDEVVHVSTLTGAGMHGLEQRLSSLLGQVRWDGVTLTRARHRSLVARCAEALARATEVVAGGGSEEYVLVDVHDAIEALGELRRVEDADDVLDTIFSTFCIGK